MNSLKVLELYSGIGGMHYALKASKLDAIIVAAVDINPHANIVYKHNFKDTMVMQKTIEGIKIEEYEKLDFDMILMSPPCQPFTRQGNQNGAFDNRSQSFMHLIELIPQLKKKPKYILMENVKGFDESTAHDDFVNMLASFNYSIQEFLLTPIQFGIPNSRLRYFLIAKLNDTTTAIGRYETKISQTLPIKAQQWIENLYNELRQHKSQLNQAIGLSQTIIKQDSNDKQVSVKETQLNNNYQSCCQSEYMFQSTVKTLNEFIDENMNFENELKIKDEVFDKNIQSGDFVTTDSTRTSCFTKNYGRYVEGTGSILITSKTEILQDESNKTDECKYIKLSKNNLRFLSPKEIANLHCFPASFEFPNELTTIQKWRLIGNSLNVMIVSVLIKLMIEME